MFEQCSSWGASGRLNPWRKSTLARTFDVLAKCDLPLQPPQNRAPNGAVRGVWSYQLEHEHPYIGRVNVRVANPRHPREYLIDFQPRATLPTQAALPLVGLSESFQTLKRVTGAEATSPRRPWAAPCHASPGLGRRATVRVPAASKATPQRLGSPVAGSPPAGLCIPRFWRNPRPRSRPRGVSRYHASRRSALCFSTFGEEKPLRRGTRARAV